MDTTVRLHSLSCREAKAWMVAALFVAGNIALPQLFHLMPQGGMVWLPIYFFTLVGAYKYGWQVGLLTAVASPLVNSLAFSMPAAALLPVIILKSSLLALAAGYAAHRFNRVTLPLLAAVVIFYQTIGAVGEWLITGSIDAALRDIRIGYPGMLLQVVGGYLFIRYIIRKN